VLVDGIRLNDAQTGHHNSDIPVPLAEIERVEVVHGAASALHGADAVGGTINIITRKGYRGTQGSLTVGGDGYVAGDLSLGRQTGQVGWSLAASGSRSSGFMYDRDFAIGSVSSRVAFGRRTSVLAAWTRKAFGANGFYGPSPSKEWTNQTLVALERRIGGTAAGSSATPAWDGSLVASYRTHGDRFLWDIRRPGQFENRHRTHTAMTTARVRRTLGPATTLSVGGDAASEWILSTALGDHQVTRGSVYAEIQRRLGYRLSIISGLRYDAYSTFGDAWSPSASLSWWLGSETKLRGGIGRTFRIPTFTERFYRDPAHRGTDTLQPERGWEVEAGADRFWRGGWTTTVSGFRRVERGLIDWWRENPSAIWRTANLGRVRTRGLEVATSGPLGGGHSVRAQYAFVDLDAGDAAALLKYSQDYARHVATLSATLALPWRVALTQRAGYIRRVDGRLARVWDAKASRDLGRITLSLEGTNLLDQRYQETRGVDMPGRWVKLGIAFDLR
jgi:iron complex outermembrane receptor protein